jgi:uncharacterized protein YbaR (Trm112 family)
LSPHDREATVTVNLDPQLLEILACPSDDHAPLTTGTPDDPDADMLTCTSCGRRYPVTDGIPVLLLDEAITAEDNAVDAVGTDGVESAQER